MNGIGKIAAGMVGQEKASQEAKSRAPWITGSLKTRKHQSNVGLGFQALALGSSMYSTYQKGIKPYEDIQAGAKEAGVEMDEASFGEKLKIGFGFQDVGLDETHQAKDTTYTGATLMDIGARAKSGTLQSYVNEQGTGKTIGDVFGTPSSAEELDEGAFEQQSMRQAGMGTGMAPESTDVNPFGNTGVSMMDKVEEGYTSPEKQPFDAQSIMRKGSSVDEQGYVTRGDTSLNIQSDPEQAFKMAYGKPMGSSFNLDEESGIGWLKRGNQQVEAYRDGKFTYEGQMHGLKGLFGN